MARTFRFPFRPSRLGGILLALPVALSQGGCQMANYQLGRLLQIPRSVLRVEAAPVDAPDEAAPGLPGDAAAGAGGAGSGTLAPAPRSALVSSGRVPAA